MAKEQASTILPLTLYTEVYWTASFQCCYEFHRIEKRKDITDRDTRIC